LATKTFSTPWATPNLGQADSKTSGRTDHRVLTGSLGVSDSVWGLRAKPSDAWRSREGIESAPNSNTSRAAASRPRFEPPVLCGTSIRSPLPRLQHQRCNRV
jgi:hypothetical protein